MLVRKLVEAQPPATVQAVESLMTLGLDLSVTATEAPDQDIREKPETLLKAESVPPQALKAPKAESVDAQSLKAEALLKAESVPPQARQGLKAESVDAQALKAEALLKAESVPPQARQALKAESVDAQAL